MLIVRFLTVADDRTWELRQNTHMKLSVMMITYNQERFIAQALESVLAQRVNFDYEIVIGEDCSTDGTREILMQFSRRYPNRIVLLLRDTNVGAMRNFEAALAACRGQYLALLEGDDYWTSPDKLQRQVDFLDDHPDYAICCARARVMDEIGTASAVILPPNSADTYTIEDLLEENFIATCTVMYRWGSVDTIPGWFREMKMGDWPLHALVARSGKINLMDDVMAVYRMHPGGIWSSQPAVHRLHESIRMLKALDKHLEFQYTSTLRRTIARYRGHAAEAHLGMAHTARDKGNRRETAKQVAGYLKNGGLKLPHTRRGFASFTAYALFGSWYEAIRKARGR